MFGSTETRLIQPIDRQDIRATFLKKHGPGLHYIRMAFTDYEKRVASFEAPGLDNNATSIGAHIAPKLAHFATAELHDAIVI